MLWEHLGELHMNGRGWSAKGKIHGADDGTESLKIK